MKFNNKNIMAFVLLVCCFAEVACVNSISYTADEIKEEFIDLSSALVAAKNKPTLLDEFRVFLAEDKVMQKVKRIDEDGTTMDTIDITNLLEKAIRRDLLQKEQALQSKRNSCVPKQVGLGMLVAAGLCTAAVASGQSKGGKNVGPTAMVGVGAASVIGGAIGLVLMSGEKGRLDNHITQVQGMKKDWDAFFVVPSK